MEKLDRCVDLMNVSLVELIAISHHPLVMQHCNAGGFNHCCLCWDMKTCREITEL